MSIELKEAAYSYRLLDGSEVRALAPSTVSVFPGEFVAVVGTNGSGKTTLAKLMNALLFPTAGTVEIDGRRIGPGENDLYARRTVGMVFQNPDNQIVATVVEDDVAFGPENIGLPSREIRVRVDEALENVGLTDARRSDPHNLSAGQRQRVAIAGMLALRPRYLVLDEPTSLLDPRGRREVLKVLVELRRRESIGLVYVTHIIEEIIEADRVLVLKDGSIIGQGSPREVLADEALMARASLYSPKPNRLARHLAAKGVGIPTNLMTAEEVATTLCSSS